MPSEGLSLVVGSGLSVGVLAGVISGIFYVFMNGLKSNSARNRKYGVNTKSQCCICGGHFKPREGVLQEVRRPVECVRCQGHACKQLCSEYAASTGTWTCKQCTSPDSWFKGILTALQSNSVTVRMSKKETENIIAKNIEDKQDEEKEIVRDFIERLVSAMLGADLDDTSVNRLYGDPEYDAIFARYHGDISNALTELGSALHISVANLPVTGQTPCTAHGSLKNIIRRVLRDVSSMTFLKQPQDQSQLQESNTNRTYEDLLATAILNKVIDNYQNDLRRSSSGSVSSRRSDESKKSKKDKNGITDSGRWKSENLDYDTASVSSIDEWCRSESSYGSKHIDQLSLTIHQKIDEISTSDDENTNSQHYVHKHNISRNSPHRSSDNEGNVKEEWQENWLFSRKGKRSPNPVPVPMLVPSPVTDYRALIGDRDAEDTTDLSETASDLDDTEAVSDIKTILVESRTIIGGKNLLDNINPELLHPGETENVEETEIVVNNKVEIEESVNEASTAENIDVLDDDSIGSHSEKDAEYTEKYATFPRKISKKSPVPSPRASKCELNEDQRTELITEQKIETQETEQIDVEENEQEVKEAPVFTEGSYSQREKQKWRNPIAINNNPYSKENLDKRLNNKGHLENNDLFSRDYYIREAKRAAGGHNKLLDDDENEDAQYDFQRQKSLPVVEKETKELHRSKSLDPGIFTAKPVIIQTEDVLEIHLEENDEALKSRPQSLALSTDSDDVDVKRVYNIETGKIFKYKVDNNTKEIIENSKSPEGMKNFVKSNELVSTTVATNENHADSFDENHNQTEDSKEPIMKISTFNHLIQTLEENATQEPEENKPEENGTVSQEFDTQMREISKKYLESLTKSNVAPENIIDYSTPPISIQEIEQENENLNYQPLEHLTSCIDLRLINNEISSEDNKIDNKFLNGVTKSAPNLFENEDRQYFSEDEYNLKKNRLNPDEFKHMPSVKNLKKLFDQESKGLKRTTSHLTTKPEFRARQKQVHSLTARSLSKEFRRELQKNTENHDILLERQDSEEHEKTAKAEDDLKKIPPTCKNKIAFFECLKNKS